MCADRSVSEPIVDVDISDDSDDEDLRDEPNHPALDPSWENLSTVESNAKLKEYNSKIQRERNASYRAYLNARIQREEFDWTMKPRTIVDVSQNSNLSEGDVFTSRQAFQLRVAEMCNVMNKIPR